MTSLLLHINSSFDRRVNDNNSSWVTYLKKPIQTRTGTIRIHLENIEFPNMQYTYQNNDNIFWYIHDYGNTNILRSLELETDRIYGNGTEVCASLNSLAVSQNYGISFFYNETKARISITNISNVPIRIISPYYFSDMIDQIYNSVAEKLGIIEDMQNTQINPNQTYLCPGIIQLLPSNCYYLTCDLLSHVNGQQSIVPTPYYTGDSILGRITSGNFASLSQLNYSNEVQLNVGTKIIDSIKFGILNDKYEQISTLNGAYITFTIVINID